MKKIMADDNNVSIQRALETLTSASKVLAAVLAAEDGLPIAVRLRSNHDRDVWAAAASAMGRMGRKVLARLGKGELTWGAFDTRKYRLLVRPVSLGYLLAICEPDANMGMIGVELDGAADALDRAMPGGVAAAAPDPAY